MIFIEWEIPFILVAFVESIIMTYQYVERVPPAFWDEHKSSNYFNFCDRKFSPGNLANLGGGVAQEAEDHWRCTFLSSKSSTLLFKLLCHFLSGKMTLRWKIRWVCPWGLKWLLIDQGSHDIAQDDFGHFRGDWVKICKYGRSAYMGWKWKEINL